MKDDWLVKMFEEAGLQTKAAQKAASESLVRLLRRQGSARVHKKKEGLRAHLVRDPLVSLIRIIGKGDNELPFVDDSGKLSSVAFSDVFAETGLDPVVAMAYAKVVVEAFDPQDLYQPVWEALGQDGKVDLGELRRLDWEPLRRRIPDFKTLPPDQRPTQLISVHTDSKTKK